MTSHKNVMPGFHVCFVPRGKRVAPPSLPPFSPEDLFLAAERTHLVMLAAAEEASPLPQAIYLILHDRLNMAEACQSVDIKQYQLHRAVKRIAMRVRQEG